VVVVALFITPFATLAETIVQDAAGTGGPSLLSVPPGGTTDLPLPPPRGPIKPPLPKTEKPLVRLNGMPPGNPQSLATGTRASTTRPLPPPLKDMLEKRDKMIDASTTGPVTPEMRARMENARDNMGKERDAQMKEFARKTLLRLRAATDRLSKLADRVDSRILKQKQSGSDTSRAEQAAVDAHAKVEKAKLAITEAESLFTDYVPPQHSDSSASGTQMRQPGTGQPSPLRDAFKKADQALRDAQKSLNDAVAALRPKTDGTHIGSSTEEQRPPKPTGIKAPPFNEGTQTPTLPPLQ
jgi:hypothetical protein